MVEQGLAALVELELGDGHIGVVDSDVDGGPMDLLANGLLDVNDPLAVNIMYTSSYGGRLKK
jgi:hypothetical protein